MLALCLLQLSLLGSSGMRVYCCPQYYLIPIILSLKHQGICIILNMSRAVKLLTYNVWFDETFLRARTHQIARLLRAAAPDVVCLQEVTAESYSILLNELDGYEFSPLYEERSYFATMIVAKRYASHFHTVRTPSEMGRFLLVGRVRLSQASSEDLIVVTSHFESLSSRPLRRKQLSIAAETLNNFPGRWILCGDFNFCSYQNFRGRQPNNLENTVLAEVLPPHNDVWPLLHPAPTVETPDQGWRGYTFDSAKNLNIAQEEKMRYDRIVVSSEASSTGLFVEPTSIALFGVDPVERDLLEQFPPDVEVLLELPARAHTSDPFSTPPKATVEEMVVFPSDHFGLLTEIRV
ncbi:endonuclease/exonuclease/phosphatase, putative [Bodo saltans]|uniref:Endonuclease/exonuclease/phosphatase, putative n=1 Tax=Bodo saltans TaxID=75058 RepID=A0A0S4JCM1_BODSA|nr:endonuclease/exonuclease/phosphatase, putative [Bodo saltans]|eukprot:CUG87878.1 endonuclease/exonuclease/phosphatase, putative [Bodo saltans]